MRRVVSGFMSVFVFLLLDTSVATAAEPVPNGSTTLRFAVSGGSSLAGIEFEGSRKVSPTPDTGSRYQGDPLAGSFQGYGLTFLRTTESIATPIGEGRELLFGCGVESLSTLGDFSHFSRPNAASFSLQMWSLSVESGLRRKLSSGQGVEILLGGSYLLDGKARFSYKGISEDGTLSNGVFDDKIASAWRGSLGGRYSVAFMEFMETGVLVEGYYGRLDFSARSSAAAMQGSSIHLFLAMLVQ